MTVHLNLGSNLGDRRALLSAGAAAVAAALPGSWSVSQPVETEPWGFESEHPFLNIGMMGHLAAPLDPEDILDRLQAIERTLGTGPHRDASGRYIDRALDIDIISIDITPTDTLPPTAAANAPTHIPGSPATAASTPTPVPGSPADIPAAASAPVPLRLETPRLTLPHPRARLRDFVLIPLRQLCPTHPLLREI